MAIQTRHKASLLVALVLSLTTLPAFGAELVISEFMAINDSTLPDGDGIFSDWIEIYNPTDHSVSLNGWFLTDNPRNPTMWPFPDISIAPRGYLVVFASGQDTDDYVDSRGYYHTNFKLTGDGEYLALVKKEGPTTTTVYKFSPIFPKQEKNVSYGINNVATVSDTTLIPSGAPLRYRVPDANDAGTDWTSPDYDDSTWIDSITLPAAGLVITEVNTDDVNWVEIQNVSSQPIDTSGWLAAVNDASSADINAVHSALWELPSSISPGQILYRTDSPDDNYWGSDISWNAGSPGWVLLVDNEGNVVDFVVWGYTESDIASLRLAINGFDNITVGGQWHGQAVPSATSDPARISIVTDDPTNESDYVEFLTAIYGYTTTIETITVLIDEGENWKYFEGTTHPSDPPNAWSDPDFDDSAWLSGPTGIGYGDNDDATLLYNMRNNYLSVFCRREFYVADAASIESLTFKVTYDDGFIAYLNGQDVGRRNMGEPGQVFTYNMPATANVSALPESVEISAPVSFLRDGRNVLAIQIHNSSLTSSDLSMIPSLASRRVRTADGAPPAPSSGATNDLLNADLVIVSRHTGNGSYPADNSWWNKTLTTPVILHSAYTAGTTKWGWLDGDLTDGSPVWDVDQTDSLLDHVNTTDGRVRVFDPNPWYQGSSDTASANGDVVAWDNGFIVLCTWRKSQGLDNGDSAASDRIFFAAPQPVFRNMTDDGKHLLKNALTSLYAPESGTFLRRVGGSDCNSATDFGWTWSPSKGAQNPDLTLPFTSHAILAITGVGFSGGLSGFESAIQTDVAGPMRNLSASLWIRIEFNDENLSTHVAGLLLRMKYDDGFVAYLNGVKVAESNAPAAPEWNSTATASHGNSAAATFEDFDISAFLFSLQEGRNVLAIHGLNLTSANDDFLILPELIASNNPDVPRYMATPTPGAQNIPGAVGLVADTAFSVDRGFYNTPFDVQITTDTNGAEIRYTLDGSEPTATHGEIYTGPITISRTTVLRAAAFKPGYIPTNVDTQTYVFLSDILAQDNSPSGYPSTWKDEGGTKPADYEMDPEIVNDPAYTYFMEGALAAIPSMSIVTDVKNLFDFSTGIYMNPEGSGLAWERPASVELIDPGDLEEFQIDCGLRIQGGASRLPIKSPKHGFRLLFKGDYGPKKLRFSLFGEDATDEFDTVILRAGFNNSWVHWASDQRQRAQYARDRFARYTQLAMGQPASHGRFVHLYLNGLYWGVYDLSERPTAPFMAAYYGGEKEDYDTLNSGTVRDGDKNAWNTMMSTANAGLAGDAQYQAIKQYLDVRNLIDFIITNHYGGNHDWDDHNWYAGRKREPGAGYQFFCWDSERTLEGVNDNILGVNNNDRPSRLFQQLRQNAEFRMLYADHLHRHFFNGGALTPQAALDRWNAITEPLNDAIIAESARWGDYRRDVHPWSSGPYELYTKHDHYDVERTRLINDYFPNRSAAVVQQYRSAGLYPSTAAPVFKVNDRFKHGGLFIAGDMLTITASYPVYYTLDGTDPRLRGGAISPTAILYTGSILLTQNVVVKSRSLNGSEWSALNEALFVLHTPPALRITEIMYHPTLGEDGNTGYIDPNDFEFIELQNRGDRAISLAGVMFTDGILFDFTTSSVTRLEPGEFVVVVKNLDAFKKRYTNWQSMNIAGQYEGTLENDGETVELYDGIPKSDLSFTYDDEWYWSTDGIGFSLVPVSPDATGDLNAREFWRPSAFPYGSPGQEDPEPTTPIILVNELLTHSQFPNVNTLELYNPAGVTLDLSGWWLTDNLDQPQKYMIPSNTILEEYLTILEDDDQAEENPIAPECFGEAFTLSPTGGEIYLYSPDLRYRHGFSFGPAEEATSFGRYLTSSGDEHFPAQKTNSFGSANAGPRIGPVVISEIMYHPTDGGHEFLELVNISDSTVHFYHPDYPANRWKVTGISFTFPLYVELSPGDRLLLVRDTISTAEFRIANDVPDNVQTFNYTGALDNAGETIMLEKPDAPNGGEIPYVVVDQVDYDDEPAWPLESDGYGFSLERIALDAYGNDVANWRRSPKTGGTPGWDSNTLDGDGDGMPDLWELDHNLDPLTDDASADPDTDGLSNLDEYRSRSDPNDPDSDDDGLPDGAEVNIYGTHPGNPDTDEDGYTDLDELTDNQSDPLNDLSVPPDNDADNVSDLNDPDDDNDGMPDAWEEQYQGLDPLANDSDEDKDQDGQANYAEYIAGTDPGDPSSVFAVRKVTAGVETLSLTWNSVPGRTYRIWASSDLVHWTSISEQITADGQTAVTEWSSPIGPKEIRGYYRVEVLPSGQ